MFCLFDLGFPHFRHTASQNRSHWMWDDVNDYFVKGAEADHRFIHVGK